VIGPKLEPISAKAEKLAYDIATARNEGVCELCRRRPGNRHHRQGRDPFNTIPSNLLLACGSGTTGCHGLIHQKQAWSRERGYIVPDWAVPSEYPLLYWRRPVLGVWRERWVLLDDRGGMREISLFEADRRIDGDWPGVRKAS
jgi:hypothetical protein